jgi:hypothetical protein
VHPSGLTDSRVHSRHGLAAILTAMTIRRTPHRVAALHRLFGLSHTDAVERIRRQSRDQSHDKDSSSHIRNRLARLSRMVVTTEGGLCPPKKKDCKHHHCRAVGVFRPQPVTGILQFRHPLSSRSADQDAWPEPGGRKSANGAIFTCGRQGNTFAPKPERLLSHRVLTARASL